MAKIQTRRSISISGRTYDELKEYARDSGQSMSGIVETLIHAFLLRSSNPVDFEEG